MTEVNQNCTSTLLSLMTDSDSTDSWLLISSGNMLNNHVFYSISKNQFIRQNISDFRNKKISSTSYYGWLAMIDNRISRLGCCLLNTVSMEKIQLPTIYTQPNWFYRCIISKPPTEPDCHILLLPPPGTNDPILYCRLGDEKYIEGSKNIGDNPFFASTNFEGKIYAWMSNSYRIVEVDFVEGDIAINELVNVAGQPLMIPFAAPSTTGAFHPYMVDCCGELLVVFMICYGHSGEMAYFRIFKINILDKEVSELKSIGDRIIFIGPQDSKSMSCGPGESNLKRDSIYYICKDNYLHVYDIGNRSKTLVKLPPIKRHRSCVMSWIA